MNVKKKILFLLIASLLIALLLPNYAAAEFTFSAHDTGGRLLSFKNPVLIIGSGASNGEGAATTGAQYMYTNVITVDGVQVNAIVSVDNMVNATLNMFDDPNPNPIASDSSRITTTVTTTGTVDNYSTSFGAVVREDAIFAPRITSNDRTKNSYVQFTINFQDSAGKPVVLKNVYNNTLDVESVEFNEYGGFISYLFSSDYLTNSYQHMIANQGLNGNIRFSNSNCDGNPGLYITDSSRVQTKFDTISSITLVDGQFANNAVPDGNGGVVTCNNITTRFYGAIFVQDDFVETGDPAVEMTAPTVNSLITSNTKPTITGTIGGFVSASSPQGSPIVAGDTFTVLLNGMTYTYPNASLSVNGVQWSLAVPTTLALGTYEVTTTRNSTLLDQTHNELIITPLCAFPQVVNSTGTGCVTPSPTDDTICHTGDTGDKNGDGIENYDDDRLRPYTKILSNKQLITGHETHPHDYGTDSSGHCPDDPVVCASPQIRDATKNMCVTPLSCTLPAILNAAGTLCVTSSVPTVVSQASVSTTPTITGTVGNLALAATESFSVLVNGTTYSLGNANLTVNGTTWTLIISTPLTQGTVYPVTATRDGSLVDTTTNELTIVSVPTVTSQSTNNLTPTITGTVGNVALNAGETFTVVVNGVTFSSGSQLSISGRTWTLNIPSSTALKAATTYDVTATRSGTLIDATSGELVITTATCSASQALDTVTNTCKTTCLATEYLNSSNACTSRTPSCSKVDGTIPATSDYNGTTMSICHFDPSVSVAAQKISIKKSDIGLYADSRGDSIWESDNTKMCPEVDTECDARPTVNPTTSLDSVPPTLTGTLGSSRSLTITINDSNGVTKATGAAIISNGSWSYSPAIPLPAGIYDVVATGDVAHGSLVDNTTKELTVTAAVLPTVNVTTATDQIAPKLTGTMGSSTSLTIAIIDSAGVTKFTGSASPSGSTWSYSPGIIAAGTYNVVATGDTAHGSLVDSTTNELTVTTSTIPTVNTTTTIDKIAPSLSGTIGASTSLTISINDSNGTTKASGIANISGINWTFKPTSPIAAGIYDVVATGDSANLVDATKNELTVTGSVIPTVNLATTTDKVAPTLSGIIGTSASLNIAIKDSSGATKATGAALINPPNVNWTFTPKVLIPVGTYDVVVTGDAPSGSLVDATTGELTVTASAVPTVDNVTTNDKVAPKLTGTVGTSVSVKIAIKDSSGNTKVNSSKATVSGATWSYTPSSPLAAGTYDVVATGDSASGGLVDTTKNELTVTASVVPTVNHPVTTTDKAIPVLTGTVGTSAKLTIAIKSGSTVKFTGDATISGSNWNYSPPSPLAAGTYEVVATGDTASGSLIDTSANELTVSTCIVPLVYNTNKNACITPVPTVVAQSVQSLVPVSPVITGTVGASALDTTETFSVTVNKLVYNKSDSALVINDMNWTLTIPVTAPLPFGNYDVMAARNTVSKDKTTNELKIILICQLPLVADGTGKGCVSPGVFPTVDAQTTDDTTPVITGSVGDTALGQTEMFSVTISGISYDRTQMTFNNTLWSLATTTALSPGTYDVIALRGNTLIEGAAMMDRTVNELTITQCSSPKTTDPTTGACTLPGNPIPTVDKLTTNNTMPTLTGTVGTTSLGNSDVFTITVNGVTYTQSMVSVSGMSWTLTIPTALPAGKTYDVDAVRNGTPDATSGELTITDNIDICDTSKTPSDQTITRSAWDPTKASETYYLGKCNAPPCDVDPVTGLTLTTPANCTPPLPKKTDSSVLPNKPDALVDEAKSVNGLSTCDVVLGGGVLSGGTAQSTNVSIKRVRIANASTENGVFDTDTLIGTKVKYGSKTNGAVDISQATITRGQAKGVTITGARLEDVYIDTANDYIDANGNVITGGSWMSVRGGTTKVNTTKEDNTITRGVITSGMITSGKDASGNPIRGRITHGLYEADIANQNADGTQNVNVLTQGRRTKGTLLNATITNATTTTVGGVTVVTDGTIAGNDDGTPITMDSKTTTSTFGTVTNATVTGAMISNSNTCFTGGSVGSRGQLNWKEVVE